MIRRHVSVVVIEEALRRIWAGETYAPPSYQPALRAVDPDRAMVEARKRNLITDGVITICGTRFHLV